MINFFKKKKGSAILIIVFLTIIVFFSVAVTITDIIQVNLALSKNQFNSTSAYFAAEVGLEEALWNVMKDEYELPEVDSLNVFSSQSHANDNGGVREFLNSSQYQVNYDREASLRIFTSLGSDLGARRAAQVRFCLPDCEFKKCGEDDGCGILCPSKCITNPGCLADPITDTNAEVVPGSEGYCCEMGGVPQACYQCKESYAWDGDSCEYVCEQDCTGVKCGDDDPICHEPCPPSCPSYPGCSATEPDGAEKMADSDDFCCGGETCYTCKAGYQWDGTECKACDPKFNTTYNEGDCATPSECRNCGVWDCEGKVEIPADSQPTAGSPCVGGVKPTVYLKMDENTGLKAYDSSSNNDGDFKGGYWQYRKKITIDYRKVAADLTNFPLLVQRTDDIDLKTYAAISGNDILFRDSNGVKLDHEIESYNSAKGDLTAWVKIPLLSNTEDTVIYMYYGNLSAANQQNPSGVWDSAYRGVWHLSDRASSVNDSTSYNNDGIVYYYYNNNGIPSVSATQITTQTGIASSSQYFKGDINNNIGSLSNLSITGNLEISAWIKTPKWTTGTSIPGWHGIFGANYYLPNYNGYAFALYSDTSSSIGFFSSGLGIWVSSNSKENFLNDGNWHHVAVSLENNTVTFYVDGQVEGIKISARPWAYSGARYLGYAPSKAGNFYGNLEEVRVSANKRDASWFKTSYDNQKNSDFLTVSGQEELPASASWTGGRYGSAISFDGTDDYLNIPDSANLDAMTRLTVSAWVKLPVGYSDTGEKVLVQKRNSLGLGYGLYNNANSQGPSLRIQSVSGGALANVALNRTTVYQSSNYNITLFPPRNAVDGNTGTFQHNNIGANEWWKVDLGNAVTISRIEMVKRSGYCDRPANYIIQYSINDSTYLPFSPSIQKTSDLVCSWVWNAFTPVSAQYVRVFDTAWEYLNIAEFRVFGVISSTDLYANQNIADGNWHHVAGTYDGTNMRIYVDGALRNSASYTGAVVANNSPLRVGASDTPSQYFSGLVDEVKVYNYARTLAEVGSDMSEKVCNGTGSCVALTSFNVNSASGQSCDDICWQAGQKCVSVGTDTSATNGLMRIYNNTICDNASANCASTMTKLPNTSTPFYCTGRQTNWTNCQCSLCVSNFGEACGGNDCIVPGSGKIDCEGNCVSPTYEPAGKTCGDPDLDYMQCDGIGNCRSLCHPLVDKDCEEELCVEPGKVNCAGECLPPIENRILDDGDNCISMSSAECWDCDAISDPDARAYCQTNKLSATKYCYSCAPNYRNICNNELQCVVRGTIDCFGNCPYDSYDFTPPHTAINPSLCDSSDEEGIGEGSGWCDGAGVCTECTPEYMALYEEDEGNDQHCNDQNECHIWGEIDCKDGRECDEDYWHEDSRPCNSGEGTNSGYCRPDNGECQECVQAYMDLYDPVVGLAPACNNDKCHFPGTISCKDGTCSTGNTVLSNGTDCDFNDDGKTDDGYCDEGACTACVSNQGDPCAPCEADPTQSCPPRACHLEGRVSCAGKCSYTIITTLAHLQPGVWCNAGYPSSPHYPQTGTCGGGGGFGDGICTACKPGYLSGDPCVPSGGNIACYSPDSTHNVYDCADNCINPLPKPASPITWCDPGSGPNTGTCDGTGKCIACHPNYINTVSTGFACNNTECHVPGTYNCAGVCSKGPNDHIAAGTPCDAGIGLNTGQCTLNGSTLEMECKLCDPRYFTGEKCPPSGEAACWSVLGTYNCAGICVGGTKKLTGAVCSPPNTCSFNGVATPCECNSSLICTNPSSIITVANQGTYNTCYNICKGFYQPETYAFNQRNCVDVGTNGVDNYQYYYDYYNSSCAIGNVDCGSAIYNRNVTCIIPAFPYNNNINANLTYCTCRRCESSWKNVCITPDQCNNTNYYNCYGQCVGNSDDTCSSGCVPSYRTGWCNSSNLGSYSGFCDTTVISGRRPCTQCHANYIAEYIKNPSILPRCIIGTGDCSVTGTIDCLTGHCMVGSVDCTTNPTNASCFQPRTRDCNSNTGKCSGYTSWTVGGVTYAPGTCATCATGYRENCALISDYNATCYHLGMYSCTGVCENAYPISNYDRNSSTNAICLDNLNREGRCWQGRCVACDAQYLSGQSCPFPGTVPPYSSICYNTGKYTCLGFPDTPGTFLYSLPDYYNPANSYKDPMECTTDRRAINPGSLCHVPPLYIPASPYWLCTNDGRCMENPAVFQVPNIKTDRSCADICTNNYSGYRCLDVGYDAAGTNNIAYVTGVDSKSGKPACNTAPATCTSIMSSANSIPCTNPTNWTFCTCEKCNARYGQDCTESEYANTRPPYYPPNYDSECYYFGRFDCGGRCEYNVARNLNAVCHIDTGEGLANEGSEGRCASDGTCSRCHVDYLNNVPCVANYDTCLARVRQCDGSCVTQSQLAIGSDCTSTTCTSNCQCNSLGTCVPAINIPNIVVPNIASNQSCQSICSGYTGRHCASVGNDVSATNGYGSYYGLDDNLPHCFSNTSTATCATIMQRSPGNPADVNYNFKCDERYTNWTNCRCSYVNP